MENAMNVQIEAKTAGEAWHEACAQGDHVVAELRLSSDHAAEAFVLQLYQWRRRLKLKVQRTGDDAKPWDTAILLRIQQMTLKVRGAVIIFQTGERRTSKWL
jgi:hypothetical protein